MTLRRSGPLKRKTELRTRTPLVGSTPLQRASRLTRSALSRRMPKVAVEERNARRLLTARSGGICEGCLSERAADFSHRVFASQGGQWCATNGLHLGRRCHSWLHSFVLDARKLGWALQRHQNPAEEPAYLPAHGLVLLRADGSVTRATKEAA